MRMTYKFPYKESPYIIVPAVSETAGDRPTTKPGRLPDAILGLIGRAWFLFDFVLLPRRLRRC